MYPTYRKTNQILGSIYYPKSIINLLRNHSKKIKSIYIYISKIMLIKRFGMNVSKYIPWFVVGVNMCLYIIILVNPYCFLSLQSP